MKKKTLVFGLIIFSVWGLHSENYYRTPESRIKSGKYTYQANKEYELWGLFGEKDANQFFVDSDQDGILEVRILQVLHHEYVEGGTVEPGIPEKNIIKQSFAPVDFPVHKGINSLRWTKLFSLVPRNQPLIVQHENGDTTGIILLIKPKGKDLTLSFDGMHFDSYSSTIRDKYGVYSFQQMFDGREDTVYAFAPTAPGETNYFFYNAILSVTPVSQKFWDNLTLYIKNGYFATDSQYRKNSRIKRIRVEVEGDPVNTSLEKPIEFYINVSDMRQEKRLFRLSDYFSYEKANTFVLPEDQRISNGSFFINLYVEEVYPGSSYTDICISEMEWRLEDK